MADINVERKKSVWPWILGLIVVIVIIWGVFELFDNDDIDVAEPLPAATAPAAAPAIAPPPVTTAPAIDEPITAAPMPPPPTDADNTPIPVAVIVERELLGQAVVGTAMVAEVVSDRAFWLQRDDQRILAVVAGSPTMENAVDLNPGQQVRLAGVVYDNELASQIAGGLEPDIMELVAGQPAFVLVDSKNILLVEP